ncbi:Acetylornithine deacetylase [Pseudomonas cannabina]|uniref:Acetylornithine deacetylase n=1 Tax=Pseudomonas cannabina TaxID=86840 RepID=A0A0P9LKL1_PSECA|nr:hypothetical protein ALO81_101693 [Pseudomonas cannabina]RMN22363.1 Acetylornithine deacetylase [Pseudomonas cannabina]
MWDFSFIWIISDVMVSARSEIRFTELPSYPGLDSPLHRQAAELIAGFCGSRAFGTVAFGTEGGSFNQSGIPAVVCGPGSMEQGHKPDEFINADDRSFTGWISQDQYARSTAPGR